MQTLALRSIADEAPAENRAGGGELFALARGLYERLTGGDDELAYNVQGGMWLTQRVCSGRGGDNDPDGPPDAPCKRAADCTHDRPRRPVSGAVVPVKEWRPAMELIDGKETPRRLTPWTILDHIRGRYWCAPEASSWTSWVAIDIDAHTPAGASEAAQAAAIEARDRTLAAVWRACGWGRACEPIVMLTPGEGYHVYLPLTRDASANPEHTWPSGWATEWLKRHLVGAGLELRSGSLEIYPAGRRLRAPCGRRMILLEAQRPDDSFDLGLVPWRGTAQAVAGGELVRRVEPTVRAFLGAWDARRRPLADWLGGERPAARWDRTWGFFALRPGAEVPAEKPSVVAARGEDTLRSQQIDAVPGPPGAASPAEGKRARAGRRRRDLREAGVRPSAAAGSSLPVCDPVCNSSSSPDSASSSELETSGPLVRGPAYWRKVTRLLAEGVQESRARHDAVLTLTFYFACSGLSDGEVMERMRAWCRSHRHEGDAAARGAFERETMGACKRYLRSHGAGWRRGGADGRRWVTCSPLAPADRRAVLMAIDPAVHAEAGAILSFLAGLPRTESGRPASAVELAGGLLRVLCPDRRLPGTRLRAHVLAINELIRIGVLALYAEAARRSHGRIYTCAYRFGSGELPELATLPADAWSAARAPIAPVPSLAVLELPAELAPALGGAGQGVANDQAPIAAVAGELAAIEVANDETPIAPVEVAAVLAAKPSGMEAGKPSEKPSRNLLGSLPRSLLPVGASSAPSISVRVLGERDVPEGRLYVLSDGTRARPRVIVVGPGASLRRPVRGAWWVRMYRHRPFTPAELEQADPATTIPIAARGRPSWLRRPPPGAAVEAPGAASDASAGAVVNAAPADAIDPRSELAAVLGSTLPSDLDPDLAAVMLGAITRRTPKGW